MCFGEKDCNVEKCISLSCLGKICLYSVNFLTWFLHKSASDAHYLWCSSFSSIKVKKSIPEWKEVLPLQSRGGSTRRFIVPLSLTLDRLDSVCKEIILSECQLWLASIPRQAKLKGIPFPTLPSNPNQTLDGLLWDLMAPCWSDQILWPSHTQPWFHLLPVAV